MSSTAKFIRIALVGLAVVAGPLTLAIAQEISESRLAAAESAMKSAPTLGNFDNILPGVATKTKDQLIRLRPDLHKEISGIVDDAAFKLAVRRADLDNDIARTWAKRFTDDELKAIDTFFSSEAGKKYKSEAGELGKEILKASRSWTNRINDELLEKSREELKKLGFEL
ncbi:MAG: DUF2059 domain-containing protein [Bauldia sp.]